MNLRFVLKSDPIGTSRLANSSATSDSAKGFKTVNNLVELIASGIAEYNNPSLKVIIIPFPTLESAVMSILMIFLRFLHALRRRICELIFEKKCKKSP